MRHPLQSLLALAMVPLLAAGCESSPPDPPAAERLFAPDLDLTGDVEAALERWSAATGVPMRIDPAGVPVVFVDRLPTGTGTESRGATTADGSRVMIHVRAPDRPRTVLHELGHALGGVHVDTWGVLSHAKGYAAVIDAASLASVCAELDCAWFRPESE